MEPSNDGNAESVRADCAGDRSTSTSSCVSEAQETFEDAEILRLLDAMDRLLNCRDSLASLLSQGWMEIASARYSMGPSRIDQALFSLKPCPASMLVTFSALENSSNDEGSNKEGEETCDSQQEYCFSLSHSKTSISSQNLSANSDVLPKPKLRQRHSSGSHHTDINYLRDEEVLDGEGDSTQDIHKAKNTDALTWFGALVSPHLRRAQSSFQDALEIVVEMATVQSAISAAYRQLKEIDAPLCKGV